MTVGLLPAHVLGDVPVSELDVHAFNQIPVGTGPYQVAEPYELHDDGSASVVLSVFPQYYGSTAQIEKIRFVAYPTSTALAENPSLLNPAARISHSL